MRKTGDQDMGSRAYFTEMPAFALVRPLSGRNTPVTHSYIACDA